MIILAVDLGLARTGIAVCDKSETFAFPRDVIKEYNREKLFLKIAETAKKENAELIVLGLPKNMDGSEGFKAEESYAAKEKITELSGLEVDLWDERCTTVIAHNDLSMNGLKTKKHKEIVDSVAAVVILEDYIRYRKNQKQTRY